MILGLSLPYLWIRLMRNPVGWIIEYIWTTRQLLMLFLLWILCTVLALILVTTRSSKASTAYRKYFHALIVIVFTSGVFIDVSFLYLSSVVGLCVMVLLEHMRFKNIEPIASLLNSFFQVEKLLDTVPQYAERILNKTAKAIKETFAGFEFILQGFRIYFV